VAVNAPGSRFLTIEKPPTTTFEARTVIVPRTGLAPAAFRMASLFFPPGKTWRPYVPPFTRTVSPAAAALYAERRL
jgi:hypothetical protein